jgi:hypothetical protein
MDKNKVVDPVIVQTLDDYRTIHALMGVGSPSVFAELTNAAALNRQTCTMEKMISIREGADPVDELVATRADLNRLLRAAGDYVETPNSFSMDTLREFTNEITAKYK